MFAREQGVRGLTQVCNILELVGVLLVLALAFTFQLVFKELPCPLCLLQRLGFFFICFGLLMNLRFGPRPSHYSIIILSCVFTSFVALRQIALHVVPGTGAYGDPVFGLHLYTWSFVVSMLVLIGSALIMGVDRQYQLGAINGKRMGWVIHILFIALVVILALNIVGIFMECGFYQCPENPSNYIVV